MRKSWLATLLFCLWSCCVLCQQIPQQQWIAYNPSGVPILVGVDSSGNIYTTGRSQYQIGQTGYIPQIAPIAYDSNGNPHVLLVDSLGNLKVTGGGGSGAACPNQGANNICLAITGGDMTSVINSTISTLASAGGGSIWFPCGTINTNGPNLDTSGSNAVIPMPVVANYTGNQIPIFFHGCNSAPIDGAGITSWATTTNTGNLIGGFDAATGGGFPGFTNVWLGVEGINFILPNNTGIVAVNARNIENLTLNNDQCAGSGTPTSSSGCFYYPLLANNVRVDANNLAFGNVYNGIILGEHSHNGSLRGSNSTNCFVADNGPPLAGGGDYVGNSSSVDSMWGENCTNFLTPGTYGGTVNIAVADSEETTGTVINDPSNLLYGIVNYSTVHSNSPTASIIGGLNLQISNLRAIPQFNVVVPKAFLKICGDINAGSGCVPTASSTVFDSSLNANNGTWHGTPSGTNNWYSVAQAELFAGNFDGSTNYIQTGYTPASITSFTVIAWIKPTSTTAQFVLSTRPIGVANGIYMLTNNGPGSTINIDGGFSNAASNTQAQITSAFSGVGVWHCVAMTHVAGISGVTLYVDGDSTGSTITNPGPTNPGDGGALYIGQDGASTSPFSYNGEIGDVRFYTSVLNHNVVPGCI